jgi:hypothetical protein
VHSPYLVTRSSSDATGHLLTANSLLPITAINCATMSAANQLIPSAVAAIERQPSIINDYLLILAVFNH